MTRAADPAAEPPELELDDLLCFALYTASRAMTARYRPRLDALGLTYPQYLVLVALADGEAATVRDLGERLRLDSGTLSPLLRRLESAGLITRSRHQVDERSVLVRATNRGIRLRDDAGRINDDIATSLCSDDAVAAGIDVEGLRDVLRVLETELRKGDPGRKAS